MECKPFCADNDSIGKAIRFVLIFLLVFAFFYLVPYSVLPWHQMEFITANISVNVLNTIDSGYGIYDFEGVWIQNGDFEALIIPLCTGYLEMVVLAGLIVASEDRTVRSRLIGIIGGFLVIFFINPFRVAWTISIIRSSSLDTAMFAHDVMFKLFLFVFLVGYYILWYIFLRNKIS